MHKVINRSETFKYYTYLKCPSKRELAEKSTMHQTMVELDP